MNLKPLAKQGIIGPVPEGAQPEPTPAAPSCSEGECALKYPAGRSETPRPRLWYAGAALLTVLLGLGSRRFAAWLPLWLATYAGDVLWALLVFWLIGWCCPRLSSGRVAAWSVGLAFGVEFSQLYHAPWLDALRRTTPGALVLGQGFVASDLLCYTGGVLLGYCLERRTARSRE